MGKKREQLQAEKGQTWYGVHFRVGNPKSTHLNNPGLPQWSIADTMADASTLNALAAWATALQAAEQKLEIDTRSLIDRISRLEQRLGGSDIESRLQKLELDISNAQNSSQYSDDSQEDDDDDESDEEYAHSPVNDIKKRRV